MTPEQKQQAKQLIADWTNVSKTSTPAVWFLNGDCMAGFLQELIDAPTPEPFGYFKAEPFGWTDCAETDDGAIALFDAPPAPDQSEQHLGMVPADVARDAERWQMLPAFLAEFQVPYLQLVDKINAAIVEQQRGTTARSQ